MARQFHYTTYTSSEDLEPIEIYVGPPDNETKFLFRPMIAGTDVMALLSGLSSESAAEVAEATMKLLSDAVKSEDHDQFFEFISDADNMVGPMTLENIAMDLAETYMQVPTEQEQSSSNGSAPNGSGREGGSSKAKAPTSKRSTRAS